MESGEFYAIIILLVLLSLYALMAHLNYAKQKPKLEEVWAGPDEDEETLIEMKGDNNE